MPSVHEFWEEQADKHGTADLATAPDHHYRKLEIGRLASAIATIEHDTILDVGCGNGYSTIELAKKFPASNVLGVDFSAKMIEQAKKAAKDAGVSNVSFFEGDVLSISRHQALQHLKFDVVISTRCLINLANWDEQKLGILQMRKLLAAKGHLILIENMQDGLEKLNKMRGIVGLTEIKLRWHNFYLPTKESGEFFTQNDGKLFHIQHIENIGNLYYIISRVVYAKMAEMLGEEIDYNHPLNEIAAQLPTLGDNYACSPNYMIIMENIVD